MWRYMRDLDQIKLSINVHKEKENQVKDLCFAGISSCTSAGTESVVSHRLIKTNQMLEKWATGETWIKISHHNMFDCAHMHDNIPLVSGEQR